MSKKLFMVYTFLKKALCLYILGSYLLTSLKEAFFCDRNFFRLQKTFLVSETFFCENIVFLWQKLGQIFFCDGNLFSKGRFALTDSFVWKKLVSLTLAFFCEGNYFLSWRVFMLQQLGSVTETSFDKKKFF